MKKLPEILLRFRRFECYGVQAEAVLCRLCSECLVVDWLVLPEFQFQRPAFLCSSMMKTKPEDEGTKRRRRERKKGGFGYELMSYDSMNDRMSRMT
ncbi:hypothetical protein Acr_29g0008310 [Actinidia rufa]|uniref:Uncharacterized protein n=1 Tax=Actinidia rufa TaxID=165716 RepID=A0A7J0HF20_9ERIC|nr:hypothetical protein Acr_26g0006820 [Actinidia rufa]GFZ21669.1 hypothetical protein Acr_29g0008310 [Actinidia rufa]